MSVCRRGSSPIRLNTTMLTPCFLTKYPGGNTSTRMWHNYVYMLLKVKVCQLLHKERRRAVCVKWIQTLQYVTNRKMFEDFSTEDEFLLCHDLDVLVRAHMNMLLAKRPHWISWLKWCEGRRFESNWTPTSFRDLDEKHKQFGDILSFYFLLSCFRTRLPLASTGWKSFCL